MRVGEKRGWQGILRRLAEAVVALAVDKAAVVAVAVVAVVKGEVKAAVDKAAVVAVAVLAWDPVENAYAPNAGQQCSITQELHAYR